ncbi:hypothetical protein ES703_119894 [subsurface metagenome]
MPKVQSLGEYLDPTSLVGEVKLEEGANIEITRDDEHNSLIITNTLPAPLGAFTAFAFQLSTAYPAHVPNPPFTVSVA